MDNARESIKAVEMAVFRVTGFSGKREQVSLAQEGLGGLKQLEQERL